MDETPGLVPISTKLEQIATLAQQRRDQPLTTLAHHIDLDWLHEAHRRTRKDGATGVDGQTADEYAMHLEDNCRRPPGTGRIGRDPTAPLGEAALRSQWVSPFWSTCSCRPA